MSAEQTLKAIELAHKILQRNLVDSGGRPALDNEFLEHFDSLLHKFHETRELLEAMQ